MSARSLLATVLTHAAAGDVEAIADQILNEHAHELAEKIRAAHSDGAYEGWAWTADLIDPEA